METSACAETPRIGGEDAAVAAVHRKINPADSGTLPWPRGGTDPAVSGRTVTRAAPPVGGPTSVGPGGAAVRTGPGQPAAVPQTPAPAGPAADLLARLRLADPRLVLAARDIAARGADCREGR